MKATIRLKDLKRLIKSTAKFISKDECRPMLNYIQLDFNKDNSTVQAASLDGYRISIEKASCNVDENFTAYIKPYLPVGTKAELATIEIVGENCLIEINGRIIGYKQPQGEFVDVAEILDRFDSTPTSLKAGINEAYLLDALKSIQKENPSLNDPLVIEIKEGNGPVILKTKNGQKAILPIRSDLNES